MAEANKSTAGGLDGWAWNEIKSLPLARFSGLAVLLNLVETNAVWPQGFLDAHIAMIRKVDGDSTPLGQHALCVQGGSIGLSSVWVMGCRRLRLGFPHCT